MLKFKTDAGKRFLKTDGKLIPSWLELYVVPVEAETIWAEQIGLWRSNYYGVDFSPVKKHALSQRYVVNCSGKIKQLAVPSMIFFANFYEMNNVPLTWRGETTINKRGVFHGLVGFHRIGLSQHVVISTSPDQPPQSPTPANAQVYGSLKLYRMNQRAGGYQRRPD